MSLRGGPKIEKRVKTPGETKERGLWDTTAHGPNVDGDADEYSGNAKSQRALSSILTGILRRRRFKR